VALVSRRAMTDCIRRNMGLGCGRVIALYFMSSFSVSLAVGNFTSVMCIEFVFG
jgi:hypothetical protein